MAEKEKIVHCPKFGAFIGLDCCNKDSCLYCGSVEDEFVYDKEKNAMKPTGGLIVNCTFPTRRVFFERLINAPDKT